LKKKLVEWEIGLLGNQAKMELHSVSLQA